MTVSYALILGRGPSESCTGGGEGTEGTEETEGTGGTEGTEETEGTENSCS